MGLTAVTQQQLTVFLFFLKLVGEDRLHRALFQVLIQFRFQGGSVKARATLANSTRMGVAVRVWIP